MPPKRKKANINRQSTIAIQVAKQLVLSASTAIASIVSLSIQARAITQTDIQAENGNTVINTGDITAVSMQAHQTHEYLGYQVPIEYFLVACVVLAFIGALLSLRVDYVKKLEGSNASKVGTALVMGLVCTFVVLPLAVNKPNVLWLMITALLGGLAGSIMLHIIIELLGDKELLDSVKDVVKQFIIAKIKALLNLFGGNK